MFKSRYSIPVRIACGAVIALLASAAGCDTGRPANLTRPAVSSSGPAGGPGHLRECPFTDQAQALGIAFAYRNGSEADQSTILESLGGGIGWLDYDRDGWLDLVATGGGGFGSSGAITGCPAALFRSQEGRRFSLVTAAAAFESDRLYTCGLTIGDYDNDGFQDILIAGYGPPQLWHNLGDGTFLETSSAAGVVDPRWSSSAAWADLNADGNLDLYICHYVNWSFANHPYCSSGRPGLREICPPREYNPLPHVVYFSRGDGSFDDATARAGLRHDGKGLGVVLCDVEPDGDVDIYVANDTTDNFLYLNDGKGKFAEVGIARGVAFDDLGIPNGSMGVDMCDYNQDLLPDLWVANYEHESFALYRNEGAGNFLHVSRGLGITDLNGLFVGFGTACEDFDADGDQDFLVTSGHVIKYPEAAPRKQLPLLLEFTGRRFERARFAPGCFFEEPHEGRGLAVADYDRDGDLDAAISHLNEPLALLENRFHKENRWLSLRLIGTKSNRDAVGARIELAIGERRWQRQVTGGGSYESHHSRDVHFVIPAGDEPRKLTIFWPAGHVQTVDVSSATGPITLLEPDIVMPSSPPSAPREAPE